MSDQSTTRPDLKQLTGAYLKVGNTTFGGGDPTIAALQRELCARKGWLSQEQFTLAYSLARITPGTNLLAFVVATAWMLRGWAGAWCAILAVTLPSSVLAVWLSVAFGATAENPVARSAVSAVLAATVGMVGATVWLLLRPSLKEGSWVSAIVIAGGTLLLREWPELSPMQLIAMAAAAGFLWPERDAS